ncbi:MAG: hypothetical protein GXO69_02170 [Acidobacteria bacterium]|nr:hypothetical protein [Acidobacteriota bacterium]
MKKLLLIGLAILMAVPLTAAQVKKPSVDDFAAGRIRFVQGSDATFTFNRKNYSPGLDYLVLLGATFETHDSRLELVTLNQNLYWFNKNTNFYFESISPKGETTKMFLGKGAFVVETRRPFTMICGAGSVFFPAHGRYLVMKNAFGKDKVYLTTLKGDRPLIVKKATIFSRIKQEKKSCPGLTKWVAIREADWKKTIARTNIFSHVDKMPPYIAYTGADGKTHWEKVNSVHPIYRMEGMLADNWFLYDATFMNAMGLWSPYTIGMDEFQMALYFASNRWNSVRWAWNVENGWHAQWYWDPLAGFGAQYQYAFMGNNNLAEFFGLDYDYLMQLAGYNWRSYHYYDRGYAAGSQNRNDSQRFWQRYGKTPVVVGNRQNRQRRVSRSNPWTQALAGSRIVRAPRWITRDTTEWLRRRVDRSIRSERQARRLNTSNRLIARASMAVRNRQQVGRITRMPRTSNRHFISSERTYFPHVPTVATTMPLPVTTRKTRTSRH